MKVHVAMSGYDNHDADPHLREVFANRDDAVRLIEKECEEAYQRELEFWSEPDKVRKKITHDRWAIEVNVGTAKDHWFEDRMWIIKEKEVI